MLGRAVRDLDIAENEIERMASTDSFLEFEEAWQNCHGRMERAWESVERKLRQHKAYQQFIKPYKRLREKDPLLIFLRQARNAETHAISGTIDKPLQMVVQDKIGRPFQIDNVEMSLESGVLTLNIRTPDHFLAYDVKILPTSPKLTRFANRGVWYQPPGAHLGNPILNAHPVVIAKVGLQFYRSLITDAQKVLET